MSELRRLNLAFAALLLLATACGDDSEGTQATVTADAASDAGEGSGSADGSGSGADAGTDADSPDADTTPVEPADDGAACTQGSDCASGFCLTDEQGFPGGLCTVFDCSSRQDCFGVGTACLRGQFNGNLCVPLCVVDADCRDGFRWPTSPWRRI